MSKPYLFDINRFNDIRGSLSFLENSKIPFEIQRSYWLYDGPGGSNRGGHAFKKQKEIVISLSGSFDIIVRDDKNKYTYNLNRSYFGLFVPNGFWREMTNFSSNSCALILSSTLFDEDDYIRDFSKYCDWRKNEI